MNSMAHSFYNLQYWYSPRNKHTSTCIALNNKGKQSAIKMNCLLMPIKTLSCSTIYRDMHYKKICKIMKKKLKITTKYDSKVRSQLNSDTAMIGMIFLHGVFDGPGISARVIAFHDIAGSGIDQPPSQVDLFSQYSCSTVLVRVMQVPQFLECSLLWIQGNHFL